MSEERTRCRNRFTSGKTGSIDAAPLRLVALARVTTLSLLWMVTCCVGCALRFETTAGDSWSMGLSRHTVELRPLDHEMSLAKENSQAAPFEFAVIPFGIEASFGGQRQVRGVVLPNSATNRFLAPSSVGLGKVNGWYFGFVHYRIPHENNRVRLLANSVKGGALRIANADPYLKIGISKTAVTTVIEENISGEVEYRFSLSAPDFNYSTKPPASP